MRFKNVLIKRQLFIKALLEEPWHTLVTLFSACLVLFFFSFGLALFEAVDQSNDAIQITGKDSSILVSTLLWKLLEMLRMQTRPVGVLARPFTL